ncbi:MAG: acyl-CoA-binding protein [Candidatus Heimdallarchaeota archaeon]|nr:MAG: acyl-CoA-binding protein [Candidatus Heimdallarchaeota archaeon]
MSEDTIKAKFEDAVQRASNLPNQPPEILLEMYGLYKQALVGDVTGKRPGRVKIKARYKYDAWASRKGMSQEDAMKTYIKLIQKLEST